MPLRAKREDTPLGTRCRGISSGTCVSTATVISGKRRKLLKPNITRDRVIPNSLAWTKPSANQKEVLRALWLNEALTRLGNRAGATEHALPLRAS